MKKEWSKPELAKLSVTDTEHGDCFWGNNDADLASSGETTGDLDSTNKGHNDNGNHNGYGNGNGQGHNNHHDNGFGPGRY